VDTRGYEGAIYKDAVVHTNDPKMSLFSLGVRAYIQVPISVRPHYVRLDGREDVSTTSSIEITAGLDKPLMLEPGQFNLEGKITYRIEELDKGRSFRVDFTNVTGFAGSFRGALYLKTNYDEKPVIAIGIAGQITGVEKP